MSGAQEIRLSVPRRFKCPRPLTDMELVGLRRVADCLIPATGVVPAPSSEPDFDTCLQIALDARADAFEAITSRVRELAEPADPDLFEKLERLDADAAHHFQALSAVVAGAWLMTEKTSSRLNYHGQQVRKATLEEAVDQLSGGILEPVEAMAEESRTRWKR